MSAEIKEPCEHVSVIQQSFWGGDPRCQACGIPFVPNVEIAALRAELAKEKSRTDKVNALLVDTYSARCAAENELNKLRTALTARETELGSLDAEVIVLSHQVSAAYGNAADAAAEYLRSVHQPVFAARVAQVVLALRASL